MTTTTKETLQGLASKDSEPMYVFHRDRLIKNICSIRKAFSGEYGNFEIGYSFKTNYLRSICEQMKSEGAYAEVVSPHELSYAKALGFTPDKIIYNGVIPDPEGKAIIAYCGGMVNVDNYNEYKSILKVLGTMSIVEPVRIGVRVNFDCENNLNSRFGIDINGDEFRLIMEDIEQQTIVKLGGFHCHIGMARQLNYWSSKARAMIDLAKRFEAEYIDLGGGMYGPMINELSSQFSGYVGSFNDYAEVIGKMMKRAFPHEEVKLILENGTAMVGNTMDVISTVTGIKAVRGQTYITVDCCSNHLGMLCECKDIPMDKLCAGDGEESVVKDAIVAGCTCLELDYIKKCVTGTFAIGDRLLFSNVGAYSISASRQFIVPRLKVIDADTGEQIGMKDNYVEMFYQYIFPSKLAIYA